jgi:hypothetical protein
MVYIGGAYDSKDYGAINHFETPQKGVIFYGITKKRYPSPIQMKKQ